ncbi:S8 family serine peptidase [filamentous cyanobacterium LEGE 11480]|uniref:S8 family serine peptidase n=1 Tax=Romeriopsis navalis LEGE 11480 TaxID=2777977 RepID=A0A928Z589_9CYAN|nr:S8 family serine peptidase [Romeriopsis navalis]MBE9031218.1 S8 family serine peptidase [Romeriopsis navalis LEGE 11480]
MSLANSISNTPLSDLIGSELLSASLGYGLEPESSSLNVFGRTACRHQSAAIEPAPQWSDTASLTSSKDFLMDGFEVLAEHNAVSQGRGVVASLSADSIIGQAAMVGAPPSFEAASAQSDWFVDRSDNSLATATYMGWLNGAVTANDVVGTSDPVDFYSFAVGQNSTVTLSLTGITNNSDLYLIHDFNGNQTIEVNEVLDFSKLSGKAAETLEVEIGAGFYHIAVTASGTNSNYSLNISAAGFGQTQALSGSLGADRFIFNPAATRSIFSGNGNIDFGSGRFDYIDATAIRSSSVVDWNLAGVNGSGVAHDDGTGTRIFDAMTLMTGQQILFEGMDTIQFADITLPLNTLTVTPNDPGFAQQWNLHMMGVHNAWRFTTGSDEVAIGVADTGLGFDAFGNIHSDLQRPNVLFNLGNVEDEFFRAAPVNQGGGPQSTSHGTAVHGIIGAATNNGEGISGINWNSTMINVDVLDMNTGDYSLEDSSKMMIDAAEVRGEKLIINMSLGANNMHPDAHKELEKVIAENSNTLFVISAGNSGHKLAGLASPAALAQVYDNVIAVGASWGGSDEFDRATNPGQRIVYDNWGSQYGPGLTLMGPSEVMSTMAENTLFGTSLGYHQHNAFGGFAPDREFEGTSAAAPNVSGVASLVWSANSGLTAGQIKQILSETAYRNIPGYNQTEYGNGFVNADAAVRRAIAMG